MTQLTTILWVDDDAPLDSHILDRGTRIVCVHTCWAAAEYLTQVGNAATYVVVDLVVPQGGWQSEHLYRFPGLALVKYVRQIANTGVPVVVYSRAVTAAAVRAAREAGATAVYDKRLVSFPDLVAMLVKRVPAPSGSLHCDGC